MPFTSGPIVNQSSAGFSVSTIIVTVVNDNPSFTANVEIEVFALQGTNLAKTIIGHDLFTLDVNSGLQKAFNVGEIPAYEIQIDFFRANNVVFTVFALDAQGNFVPDKRILTSEFSSIDRLTL